MSRGGPDNIERIATNVRIDGSETVHRGWQGKPACSPGYAGGRTLILTTAERTCNGHGCRS